MTKRICLNKSVLDFMESFMGKDSFVIEFGSGYSTPWFAARCGRLISIETDWRWMKKVKLEMPARDECKWEIRLTGTPKNSLGDIEPGTVDLILVDGVEVQRKDCSEVAWRLIKIGGWVLLDDAQREVQSGAVRLLNQLCREKPLKLVWQEGDIDSAKERLTLAWKKL